MEKNSSGGISQDSMMHQAQHIWSMLDDMSANDPAAYRKFIDKQIKEGKESMKPPKPHMCLQTVIYNNSGKEEMLYINVLEWNRIPNAKDDESPIPVMGGPLYPGKDNEGTHKIVAVGFNPEILSKYGLDSNLYEERRMLINLAIDYIQDQHKIQISRHYTMLNKDNTCKGPQKLAIQSLTKKTSEEGKEFQQQLDELEKTFGPAAQGCKDSLLSKLSNIAVGENDDSNGTEFFTKKDEPEIKIPGANQKSPVAKKGLVEELSEAGVVEQKLPEPMYDLIAKDVKGQTCLVARVQLLGVTSVQQCELDISQDDIHLLVPEQYELQVPLPSSIDNLSASARFNKKTSTLTLSLPLTSCDS